MFTALWRNNMYRSSGPAAMLLTPAAPRCPLSSLSSMGGFTRSRILLQQQSNIRKPQPMPQRGAATTAGSRPQPSPKSAGGTGTSGNPWASSTTNHSSSTRMNSDGGRGAGWTQRFKAMIDDIKAAVEDAKLQRHTGQLQAAQRSFRVRIVAWIIDNIGGLFAYQMLIETMVTGLLTAYLLTDRFTLDDVKAFLKTYYAIGLDWIDFESGVYKEDVVFAGSRFDAKLATSLHSAHNIAIGLMPLQFLFLFATYPMLMRLWPVIKVPLMKLPLARRAFKPIPVPGEISRWSNEKLGTTLGTTAMSGGVAPAASSSVGGGSVVSKLVTNAKKRAAQSQQPPRAH